VYLRNTRIRTNENSRSAAAAGNSDTMTTLELMPRILTAGETCR
jgi:hypothetical protein